jgi:ketosteroid isomerase-like protein
MDSEGALRTIVDERVAAVAAKDPKPMTARQHPDIVMFNVLPPAAQSGQRGCRGGTRSWFDAYASLGRRRIDGQWLIVHDHESVPFDAATGQALTGLQP